MKKGFTLIELLIVIGIIAILAASIIIAINPGAQFAQARDATRQGHINSLNNAILSYMVSNHGDLSGLNLPSTPTEICASEAPSCTGLVNLISLVEDGHISAIPTDPSGGIDPSGNGSGYRIFTYGSDPAIHASRAETRIIQVGNWNFTDPRDNQVYRTVLIGDQLWMAENLKSTQYTNGDSIPYVDNSESGNETWTTISTGAYTVFNYSSNNDGSDTTDITSDQQMIDMYGLLYNGYAAKDSRGICPSGWRVSTDDDWKTLEMYLGMSEIEVSETGQRGSGDVGRKLKYDLRNPDNQTAPHPRWEYDADDYGIDSVGFSALPGGHRDGSSGVSDELGVGNWYWSYSSDVSSAYYRSIGSAYFEVGRFMLSNERYGFSVRCLRD